MRVIALHLVVLLDERVVLEFKTGAVGVADGGFYQHDDCVMW